MKHEKVVSSTIHSIGYDIENLILEVEFINKKGNTRYQYTPVPGNVYIELMHAPSVGKYFAEHIKNNKEIQFAKVVNLTEQDKN